MAANNLLRSLQTQLNDMFMDKDIYYYLQSDVGQCHVQNYTYEESETFKNCSIIKFKSEVGDYKSVGSKYSKMRIEGETPQFILYEHNKTLGSVDILDWKFKPFIPIKIKIIMVGDDSKNITKRLYGVDYPIPSINFDCFIDLRYNSIIGKGKASPYNTILITNDPISNTDINEVLEIVSDDVNNATTTHIEVSGPKINNVKKNISNRKQQKQQHLAQTTSVSQFEAAHKLAANRQVIANRGLVEFNKRIAEEKRKKNENLKREQNKLLQKEQNTKNKNNMTVREFIQKLCNKLGIENEYTNGNISIDIGYGDMFTLTNELLQLHILDFIKDYKFRKLFSLLNIFEHPNYAGDIIKYHSEVMNALSNINDVLLDIYKEEYQQDLPYNNDGSNHGNNGIFANGGHRKRTHKHKNRRIRTHRK